MDTLKVESDMTDIHAHEVMHMMLEQDGGFSTSQDKVCNH